MPSKFRFLLAVLCASVGSFDLHAEIAWKQKMVEVRADAKSTVLEARYPFLNAGAEPVDITRLESSCGCTAVNLEKRHYQPGESGEIVARYTIGVQTGTQTKTILVEANDGRPPMTLTLVIQVPEIVRIAPPTVQWKHDETPTPKTIALEILQEIPVKTISVDSRSAGFDAQIVALTPGRKYELTIRPTSTDQGNFSTLNIRCRFGDQEKIYTAEAMVQAAGRKN